MYKKILAIGDFQAVHDATFLYLQSLFVLITLVLTACASVSSARGVPTLTPAAKPQQAQTQIAVGDAHVQSVTIQIMQTDPVQVNAIVRGNLTEACATLGDTQMSYASNTFHIKLLTVSPTDRGCAQITTPFEHTIPLNPTGLLPGTYTVIANGVSAVFTLPADATPTVVPVTASPTAVAQPAATSAPAAAGCQDSAQYISDDGLDGTTYAPNTPFTKAWTVKNTGTCTWDDRYLVFQLSGSLMTQQPGYWIVSQGQTVAPGQTVNISIGMTSPVENGNYGSYWGLKNENGQIMPIQGGADGNSFYVKIKVNNGGAAAGKVTAESIDIELEQGSGTACTADSTYFVHASITADGPATASYEIGSTAGQISAGNFQDNGGLSPFVTGTVVFDQADTKTIDLRFVGPYPYPADITVNLRVNNGAWHNTKLSCP